MKVKGRSVLRTNGTVIPHELCGGFSRFGMIVPGHQGLHEVDQGGNILALHFQAFRHQIMGLRHVILQMECSVQSQRIRSPDIGEEACRVLGVLETQACTADIVTKTEYMTMPLKSFLEAILMDEPRKKERV